MPSLRRLLSVRTTLRLSGLLAASVGLPLLIVPSFGAALFLGKRNLRDADRRAMHNVTRAAGIAIFSTGMSNLVAKPVPANLFGSALKEGLYAVWLVAVRVSGELGRMEGSVGTNNVFIPVSILSFLAQIYAAKWGEREPMLQI